MSDGSNEYDYGQEHIIDAYGEYSQYYDASERTIDQRIQEIKDEKRQIINRFRNRVLKGLATATLVAGLIAGARHLEVPNPFGNNISSQEVQTAVGTPTITTQEAPTPTIRMAEVTPTQTPVRTPEATPTKPAQPTPEIKPTQIPTPQEIKPTVQPTPVEVKPTPTQEIKTIREMPKDLMSNEELGSLNINIINSPTVKMHLRDGFKTVEKEMIDWLTFNDPPTKRLQEITAEAVRQGFKSNGPPQRELYIVLVDGPLIDAKFLTDEQKKALGSETINSLDRFRDKTAKEYLQVFQKTKPQMIEEYNKKIADLELRYKNKTISESDYVLYKNHYNSNYGVYFKDNPTPYDLYNIAGSYFGGMAMDVSAKSPDLKTSRDRRVIFISVGNQQKLDSEGNLNPNANIVKMFRPDTSFPKASDMKMTNDPVYPLSWKGTRMNPFLIKAHEFAHFTQAGRFHPNTDSVALGNFELAEEASNKGDDSQHYMVLEVQNRGNDDGIYIGNTPNSTRI